MRFNGRIRSLVLAVLVAPAAIALAGCSADDIEFNGGLFNAVGLGSGAQTKSAEPKLAPRQALVMPPTMERIPEPGTADPAATELAAVTDHDKAANASKEELERQQAEYCKKNYELAKVHGDSTSADLAEGPLGPCRGSFVSAVSKWNKSEE